tara:strand:+ start:6743 stop:7045 length:303 start_codon:yes stop_codon:yes gene_type:complete
MWDEKQLMVDIALKKKTVCENAGLVETCDMVFPYVPQKKFCDECMKTILEERRETKNRKAREYRKKNYEKVRAIERRSARRRREKINAKALARYHANKEK